MGNSTVHTRNPSTPGLSSLSTEPSEIDPLPPLSDRLSAASDTRSPLTSPRGSARSNPRLSDPEARALAASIDRKMESVLQSVRSRGMSSGHSSAGRYGGSTKVKKGINDLTVSADDFETFSSADEDEPIEETGIVDSMANFIPPPPAPKKGGANVLRTERGNLGGSRAAREEPEVKEEKEKEEEKEESAEPEPTSPRNVAGKLMKKLTGGRKRFGAVFSPRRSQNK